MFGLVKFARKKKERKKETVEIRIEIKYSKLSNFISMHASIEFFDEEATHRSYFYCTVVKLSR